MHDDSEHLEPGTWGYAMRLGLAPICLLLVAGLHFVRVHWYDQTPWKGGGFGMFSTVDTREARFLKVFLLADGKEIPVTPPKWLEKRAEEVSAAPSEELLADFAERLAKLDWLDSDRRWRDLAARAMVQSASGDVGRELLAAPSVSASAPAIPTLQLEPGRRPDIEAVRSAEAAREAAYQVDFRAVRVELWRYRFDTVSCRLSATKTLTAERPRAAHPSKQPTTGEGEVARTGGK